MKIAAVTDDGVKLSSHFGMASSYRVLTIEEGKIVADETIEKPHHKSHGSGHGGGHDHDHEHGEEHHDHSHGEHGHKNHRGMKFFDPIKDCQVLISGGMGEPPYKRALSFGLEVMLTGGKIDAAVQAYLNGELVSDQRRVHQH